MQILCRSRGGHHAGVDVGAGLAEELDETIALVGGEGICVFGRFSVIRAIPSSRRQNICSSSAVVAIGVLGDRGSIGVQIPGLTSSAMAAPRFDLLMIEDDPRESWDVPSEGRLSLCHCRACGDVDYDPWNSCPSCWSDDVDGVEPRAWARSTPGRRSGRSIFLRFTSRFPTLPRSSSSMRSRA